jgi:hypothetical protein
LLGNKHLSAINAHALSLPRVGNVGERDLIEFDVHSAARAVIENGAERGGDFGRCQSGVRIADDL